MENPATKTALGPMIIVAADQHEPAPLVHDPWAARLLPTTGRVLAQLTRWSPVRSALKSATNRTIDGGWASFLCRKRYIDDQLCSAITKGVDAVVILGAGYDTRAVRLPELAGIPVCEVDLPSNTERKAAALHRTFVREDFLTGENTYGAERARRQFVVDNALWRFGLQPADVRPLLAEYGWAEVDQVGPAQYAARYLRPTGRDTAVSEIEHAVYAERMPS